MNNIEIIMLAIGICSDSFVISVCKGISSNNKYKTAIKCAIIFTLFQTSFVICGFIFGFLLNDIFINIENIIVFLIFFILAINILKEGFNESKSNQSETILSYFLLAIASSIDSLSVGFSIAFLSKQIIFLIALIIFFTFIFSIVGALIGNIIGNKYKKFICTLSFIILIYFGIKFLIK